MHCDVRKLVTDYIKNSDEIQHRKMTEAYWKSFLQEMKEPEDIFITAQLNDHGDMIYRIKPEKKYMKKN